VPQVKRLPAIFFDTASGAEPVRVWLQSLASEDRRRIGNDIRLIEYGWPIGPPTCRPLGKGLYEVRTTLKDRISRVLFTICDGEMILLHGSSRRVSKHRNPIYSLPENANIFGRMIHEEEQASGIFL
jgi:phage-related protein